MSVSPVSRTYSPTSEACTGTPCVFRSGPVAWKVLWPEGKIVQAVGSIPLRIYRVTKPVQDGGASNISLVRCGQGNRLCNAVVAPHAHEDIPVGDHQRSCGQVRRLAGGVAKTSPEPQFAAHEIFWTDAPSFAGGANREADRSLPVLRAASTRDRHSKGDEFRRRKGRENVAAGRAQPLLAVRVPPIVIMRVTSPSPRRFHSN